MKERETHVDNFLMFNRLKRSRIARDGHCLARAIFRGAKEFDLRNGTDVFGDYIKYRDLLTTVIDSIQTNICAFDAITIGGEDRAIQALEEYLNEKKYYLDDNIIDVIIVTMAKVLKCEIIVHYQGRDKGFDHHSYPSGEPSNYCKLGLQWPNY